jgi:hypothetical protein
MEVLRKIIKREEKQGVPPSSARGNKIALRGTYEDGAINYHQLYRWTVEIGLVTSGYFR